MIREELLQIAKPILFNTDMVRAILDGKKTVTRRAIKFPVNRFTGEMPKPEKIKLHKNTLRSEKVSFTEEPFYGFDIKPPHQLGDILYVRESYYPNYFDENIAGYRGDRLCGNRNAYKADYHKEIVGDVVPEPKWKPSIHMPKEAARIFLKVTDVRVERLQDMTLGCFLSEGVCILPEAFNDPDNAYGQAKSIFTKLWNSTLKKPDLTCYGWEANPWVWEMEFERIEPDKG